MTLQDAMKQRHTVRKYQDEPLSAEMIGKLTQRTEALNQAHHVNIRLITNDGAAIPGFMKILRSKGVKNYFVLTGPDTQDVDEKLGYCSADLMLYAQSLGLNTWWVGGMYSKANARKYTGTNEKTIGVVVVGYGQEQGIPHKSKAASEVSSYEGTAPAWFQSGVQAALLAPTGMNRQEFTIKGQGNQVSITCPDVAFAGADLGICKYHFELGAGKENFTWQCNS